jgi:hypothetical protein
MKQMYKVFLNDRLIEICAPENSKKNNLVVKFDESVNLETIQTWFADYLIENPDKIMLIHPNPD